MLWLGSHTSGAGLAVVLDEGTEEWPSVVITDELKGLVLAEVSRDWVVMFVEKDAELEIIGVGDEDSVLVSEETSESVVQSELGGFMRLSEIGSDDWADLMSE